MSIILLILKIIGITLLSIIGLLLVILFLVLFVPIRYKIIANKEADAGFIAQAKISWLLHFLNGFVKYSDDLYYRVRIIVFPIYKSDNLKKSKKNTKPNKKDINNKSNELSRKPDIPEKDETISKNIADDETSNKDNISKKNTEDYNKSTNELNINNNQEEDSNKKKDKEKKSIFNKVVNIIKKIIDFLIGIPDKIQSIFNKLINIKDNIDYYIEAINDEKNKQALALCLENLSKILKNIKPKYIKGYLHIGLEDAYSMGKMLSIYSILFPLIHDKIQLVPDYDTEIMEGNLLIKGRVTLFVVIVAGIKIYFNKDVRRMIKIFKHEE